MGADISAKNIPNAPEFICPICLLKPNVLDFNQKRHHWTSVVRASVTSKFLIQTQKRGQKEK